MPDSTEKRTDEKSSSKGSKKLHRIVARVSRWVHIYLSMFSLASILFFSVTGLTLNHPDWFFRETTTQQTGHLESSWLNQKATSPPDWNESDYSHEVDKLAVAEYLRAEHKLSGRVSDFLVFSDECEVTFQGPGYAATARIQRISGEYDLSVTCNDLISVMNDLHKGRHTGPLWSLVIDISAIVSSIVALSGMVLVFYLKLNRKLRIAVSIAGAIAVAVLVRLAIS